MDTFTNLIEAHNVGTWCKRAAWLLVLLGLINLAIDFYAIFIQNNPFNSNNTLMLPTLIAQIFRLLFGNLSSTIFSFFILYAAGTILDHMIAKPEEEEEDEEEEEEQMLPQQILPGQMQ